MKCLECQKTFESQRSLHAHIKAHGMTLAEYYEKHHPRFDMLTGDKIPFTNKEKYFAADFLNFENFKKWMLQTGSYWVGEYAIDKAIKVFEAKGVKASPPDLFYHISELANIRDCQRLFGSYAEFCKRVGVDNWFCKRLPEDFWNADISDLEILIDTREQQPLNFKRSIESKLDFGDYTVGGEHYSSTFIDRKSESDFFSTFSGGIERFRREMDRCVKFGSYMFVVVEEDFGKMFNGTNRFVKNPSFVWHNMKAVMCDYPRNVQFVFSGSRAKSEDLIPRILLFGKRVWNVDVNFFLK